MTDGEIREKFKNVNSRLKRVEDKVDKQDEVLVSINNLTTQMAIDWLSDKYFDREKDIEEIKENKPEIHSK